LQLAGLREHPAFPDAIRACAATMIDLHSRNRFLGWFLSDRALAILTQVAVCLDADVRPDDPRSGLTPGRFKSFCAQTGLCSDGRAAAILAFMRLTGHLEAETHPADRLITRLRTSEKMLETTRARLAAQLASIVMLAPALGPAAERLGTPDFDRGLYAEFLRRFSGGARLLADAPQLRLFSERDVGMLCLFAMMLGGEPTDTIPPERPVTLSIAALARRFTVSRTHILRLVRDAEAAGLLRRQGTKGELVAFAPELRQGLRNFFAAMFQLAALCARAGLDSATHASR